MHALQVFCWARRERRGKDVGQGKASHGYNAVLVLCVSVGTYFVPG
jgi:hypothetical protein